MLIEPLLDSVCGAFLYFPTVLTELQGPWCVSPLQGLSLKGLLQER